MDWFYVLNGQQTGPVDDSQLDELLRTGVVKADTLVWRQGMASWQAYATARPQSAIGLAAPPVLDSANCAECGRVFAKADLLHLSSAYVCATCKPKFLQRMREGLGPGGGIAWRSGSLLVTRREATLPDRCVKCNAPAQGRKLLRKLSWHPPAVYLLIVIGVLIYVIAAMFLSKRARVEIGLCPEHFAARRRDVLIGWGSFLGAIALFVAAGYFSNATMAVAGVGLLLCGVIYAVIRTPIVSPKRIDDRYAWLKGASPAFIAELPEFPE